MTDGTHTRPWIQDFSWKVKQLVNSVSGLRPTGVHSLVRLPKACWWGLNNGRNSCPGQGWSRVNFSQCCLWTNQTTPCEWGRWSDWAQKGRRWRTLRAMGIQWDLLIFVLAPSESISFFLDGRIECMVSPLPSLKNHSYCHINRQGLWSSAFLEKCPH